MEQHLGAAIDKLVSFAKEPEFQYGAEAIDAQAKEVITRIGKDVEEKEVTTASKKSR
jgi:hypothetical protein